jgi:hypothetical protein
MDSEKIQIPQLDSENYGIWKIQMRLFLTHKGLDQTIKEESRTSEELSARSPANVAKDNLAQKKALALIGLKVKPEFLGVIEDAEGNARTAWIKFEEMFHSVTNARKLMLRQKLASLHMEPGEKAAMYISRAKDLKRELRHAGLDASDVDLTACCGLSREFREIH